MKKTCPMICPFSPWWLGHFSRHLFNTQVVFPASLEFLHFGEGFDQALEHLWPDGFFMVTDEWPVEGTPLASYLRWIIHGEVTGAYSYEQRYDFGRTQGRNPFGSVWILNTQKYPKHATVPKFDNIISEQRLPFLGITWYCAWFLDQPTRMVWQWEVHLSSVKHLHVRNPRPRKRAEALAGADADRSIAEGPRKSVCSWRACCSGNSAEAESTYRSSAEAETVVAEAARKSARKTSMIRRELYRGF